MNNIAVSEGEMVCLALKGLDTTDASMHYQRCAWDGKPAPGYLCLYPATNNTEQIPAYTFTDIINKLTKCQIHSNDCPSTSRIRIIIETTDEWTDIRIVNEFDHMTILQSYGENELDTAYNLLLKAIDKGLLKINGQIPLTNEKINEIIQHI